jgi:tRNA threonylcarbamoyladenosine biosynthesis protein TsaE
MRLSYHTTSDRETLELGRRLGEVLRADDVVALVGELGSGKTCFTKGLARGLGVSSETIITSPSFTLVNEYMGRCTFFHMDAYRLEDLSEFLAAGLEDYFAETSVVAMEWAERWPEILPPQRIWVEFTIVDDTSRQVGLSGEHPRAVEALTQMNQKSET